MSITINGATNTLTAASGLTIAGNTAVTGTLSATGGITATGAAGFSGLTSNTTNAGTVGVITFQRSGVVKGYFGMDASDNIAVLGAGAEDRAIFSSTGLAVTGTLSATGTSSFATGQLQADATYGTTAIQVGVGGIGASRVWHFAASGSDLQFIESGVAVRGTWSPTGLTLGASVKLLPTTDNTQDIGAAATGFKEIFADNGTINTSDARRKTEVATLSAAEINAAKQLAKEIGSFKFLAAVAEKGSAARLHIGMTVQRAIEIMEGNGLDPFAYSFICHDAWGDVFVDHPAVDAIAAQEAVLDEDGNVITPAVDAVEGQAAWTEQTQVAGDKYSFRVHELLLFMAAGFEARLSALEAA